MSAVDPLRRVGQALLDETVRVLEAAGRPLPDRQYVTWASSSELCERLAVVLIRVFPGLPGHEETSARHCLGTVSAEWSIGLWRCVPSVADTEPPTFPEPAVWTAAAWETFADAWALRDLLPANVVDHESAMIVGPNLVPARSGTFGGILLRVLTEL